MVKIRALHQVDDREVDLDEWLASVSKEIHVENPEVLMEACEFARNADHKSADSENVWSQTASSFLTGLEMAEILASLRVDEDGLIAAIVYRSVREGKASILEVQRQFGEGIASLVQGVLRMAAISQVVDPNRKTILGNTEDQLDNLRKMLVAMVDDVRVALIKLAERTCAIRAVKNADETKRQRVAREVFEIYAPLAHRLGIGQIKWELEDLAFRYLEPAAYKKIALLLDERRLDRQQYIEYVINTLNESLKAAHIDAELHGRAKHIYSIWRKMQKKNIDFYQVYDVRAVRVLVPDVRDCYAALGVVHSLWQHIPREFDDYIATPKENGYRSLHTAVLGPDSKVLEVQIRTSEMHDEAELGVCAHWRYKGSDAPKSSQSYEDKIAWLRQVLEWQEQLGDIGIGELLTQFNHEGVEERVYVFTKDGHVVDLAMGSTAVDFAYRVHTEIGHRCRGAKVNGRIVPLTYRLRTGDRVEVLTSKQESPSRDWLNPHLGYIHTSRARAKVHHWFKMQARESNIADGSAILEREFQRVSIDNVDLDAIAPKLNFKAAEDVYAAIGAGDIKPSQVLNLVADQLEGEPEAPLELTVVESKASNDSSDAIQVNGVGDLMTQMARCCKPLPGDDVVGYVSVGRGVTVHRSDCGQLEVLEDSHPERIVEVTWQEMDQRVYPVDVAIRAYDRQGLLRDITQVLANDRVNLIAAQTLTNRKDNSVTMMLTLEIPNLVSLGRVLGRINQLPNVLEVKRHLHGSRDS